MIFKKLINLISGCSNLARHHSALPVTTQDGKSYRVCLKGGTPIAYSLKDF